MRNTKRFMSFVLVFAMLMTSLSCLGGVFTVTASATAPTITTNLDGITRTPGQHGRSVPLDETTLASTYPNGYVYLSGTVYEFDPTYVNGNISNIKGDFQNYISVTDGYVNAGDYVIMLVKITTDKPNMAAHALWFAHSLDFFNVPATNTGSTALPNEGLAMNASNTTLASKGAIMNMDNPDVDKNGSSDYGLTYKPTTNNNPINSESATTVKNCGYNAAQGYDPTALPLSNVCISRFGGYKNGGNTYLHGEADMWSLGILYQVKPGLTDGAMGSIYMPITDMTHTFWRLPGMKAQLGGTECNKRKGSIVTLEDGSTANINLSDLPATYTFDYSDFGATLCVGNPPAQGDTYTVTFYDSDNTIIDTIADIASGDTVALADAPTVTPPAGQNFAGWVDGQGNAISWPITVTADTAVYASYTAATYDLTINYVYANNTTAATAYTATGLAYNYAYSVTSPTIDGYTPDVPVVSGNLTADTTVTVTYTANTYTATFYDDDGTTILGTSQAAYGQNIPSIANPTTHAGATFLGWSETLGGSVVGNLGTMPIGGKSFYAKWQAATIFIDFYDGDLFTWLDNVECEVGADISLYAPSTYTVPAGETFIGWFLIDEYTFELTDTQVTVVPDEYVMLAPKFEAANFTVTFNDENGTFLGTQSGVAGDTITPPTTVTAPAGYSVTWVDENNAAMPATITGDATYHVVFVANEYTLTINYVDGNGNALETAYTADVAYDSSYSVASPTVTGYTPDTATVTGTMDVVGGKTVNVTYSPNPHTITWIIDGQNYLVENVVFGDAIVAPAPTRTGYTLSAWTPALSATVADQNYTYSATWEANSYPLTINYVDGNGSPVAETYSASVAFDSTYEVASPSVEGYTPDVATVTGTMNNVNGIVVNVTYSLNSYKATFVLAGGSINGSTADVEIMVPYGTIPQIDEPTKSGFTFGGWTPALAAQPASETTYTATWDAAGNTPYTVTVYTMGTDGAYDAGVTTTKTGVTGASVNAASAALEAGFYYAENEQGYHAQDTISANGDTALVVFVGRSQYNITFVIDGQNTVYANQYYGAALTAPEASKTGYSFTNWTPAVPETVPASNATYTANFEINSYPVSWTIDGSTTTNDVEFGTVPTAPAAAKEGYTFLGWFVTGDTSEAIVDPIPAVGVDGAAYTAKFQINQYTLTFIVNGEPYDSITQDYGTAVTAPENPTMEGNEFSCWKVDGVTTAVPETMPAQDMTFVASFGLATFTFTYIVDGVPVTRDYEFGERIPAISNPSKTGFTFDSWQPAWPETMPAGDYTVVAQFTRNTYHVYATIDGAVTTYDFEYEEAIDVPTPVKEGSTFSYWTPGLPATMPANDINTEAVFSLNRYPVTWTVDGTETTDNVSYGSVPTAPAAAKEGYTFLGWFVTGDATETVLDSIPAVGVNGAAYTAKFQINQYTVTYNLNGGNYNGDTSSVVYTIDYGTAIPVPETNPARSGYDFNGWSPEPSGNIGAANVEFTAQWAQDTTYVLVKNVVRVSPENYYECGIANWAILVEGSPSRIKICYDDTLETGWNYSRYNDKIPADGNLTGIVSIVPDGDNEIWTIRATIPAGGYKVFAKVTYEESSWESVGYDFTVAYTENTTVVGQVFSLAVDKTEIKRGDSVVFTIVTSDDINMLRLADSVDNSSDVTSTIGFTKASVGSGWASIGEGKAQWTITVPISYVDMTKASELNTYTVYFYNEATSTFVDGGVDPVSVNVTRYDTSGEIHSVGDQTVDPYSILDVTADLGKKLTYTNITVTTTSDVSKVRLTIGSKAAVYTQSSNNVTYTDNNDGSATWVIGYRFLTAGEFNIKVESRGNTWTDCSTATVATHIYNNNADLAEAQQAANQG